MNPDNINRASGAVIGLIAGSGLFLLAAVALHALAPAPDVDSLYAAKRSASLEKIRSTENTNLNFPAWIDPTRGIVRLPIQTAMQILVSEGQDGAAARQDLLGREKKATAPVAAQPNAFE